MSENDFINPLLTQDSRQPAKMFSTYCDTSRKASRTSYHRHIPTVNTETYSMLLEKQDHYLATPHIGDISDNNPMCDSDSQQKESVEIRSRNQKGMMQSKSFNNLLKTPKLNIQHGEKPLDLKEHINEFRRNRATSNKKGFEATKMSSKEYNSSIHQCKPTCHHAIINNDVKGSYNDAYSNDENIPGCITNESETISSKFNGILPQHENGFATYSNISAVPNHHDDEIMYSSVEEIAANMINH